MSAITLTAALTPTSYSATAAPDQTTALLNTIFGSGPNADIDLPAGETADKVLSLNITVLPDGSAGINTVFSA